MSIESRMVQLKEIPQKIVRLGVISALIIAGYIVIDQGTRPVYANGPASPTSTVGFSPTPDKNPLSTAVRTAVITATPKLTAPQAESTLVAEQTRTTAETKTAKTLEEINKLRGTPTETSTPTRTSTPTATPTSLPGDVITMKRDDFNKLLEQAVKIACDAKASPTPTLTATPRVVPATPIPGFRGRSEGGFPWEPVLIGGGIATVVFRRRVIGLLGHIPARIPNI